MKKNASLYLLCKIFAVTTIISVNAMAENAPNNPSPAATQQAETEKQQTAESEKKLAEMKKAMEKLKSEAEKAKTEAAKAKTETDKAKAETTDVKVEKAKEVEKVKSDAEKEKAEAVKILTSADQISQGQTVTWLVNVYGFKKLGSKSVQATDESEKPDNKSIQTAGEPKKSDSESTQPKKESPTIIYYAPADATSKIISDNGTTFTVDFTPDNGRNLTCLWLCDGKQKYDSRICDYKSVDEKILYKCVDLKETYEIDKVDAAKYHHRTSGFVSGVLVVPFKYHFSDHAVTSGSSVGGYFGRRFGFFNSSIAWIAGGGLAVISNVPAKKNFSTDDSQTSSEDTKDNQMGFTLATGLLGTIGQSNAQIGLLVGWDYLRDDVDYKYEAKPWLAFEVGYNFSQ